MCDTPFFYSQTCYRYGLYLIETGRADELVETASATAHWGQQRPHDTRPGGPVRKRGWLLSSAIDQMILSEATVRLDERSDVYRSETDEVINGDKGSLNQLKDSGYSDYLARGLNIAARFDTGRGDFEAAANHLEQNHIHVTRGKMKLLEADYAVAWDWLLRRRGKA